MARYIDAEALTDSMLEHYNELCEKYGDYDHYTTGYGDAIDAIENAPTADVAPKSEVEKLSHKCEDCAGCTQWVCDCSLIEEHAKSEVAKEIIKEIDDRLYDMAIAYRNTERFGYYAVCEMVYHNVIRAVEKKYTEGQNNQ